MQKIVIVSSQPDKDNPLLVAMLNVLFPECEIQVTDGVGEGGFGPVVNEPGTHHCNTDAVDPSAAGM